MGLTGPAVSAVSIGFSYDANGNQTSQAPATAAAPVVTSVPVSLVVGVGGIAGFSITVISALPVTYQWHFNGDEIPGATGDSLLIEEAAAEDEGTYTVIVTNAAGNATGGPYRLAIDASGNGLPDAWELLHFGNLTQSANGDFDGDGVSNLEEFRVGTNPVQHAGSGPYYAWAASVFPAETPAAEREPEADPYGRGVPNLLQFAFGMQPALGNQFPKLPEHLTTTDGGVEYHAIRFRRLKNPATRGVIYTVHETRDLALWNALDIAARQVGTAIDNSDGTETVTVRSSFAIADFNGLPAGFLRVEVRFAPASPF
jgi:hypothetical protein